MSFQGGGTAEEEEEVYYGGNNDDQYTSYVSGDDSISSSPEIKIEPSVDHSNFAFKHFFLDGTFATATNVVIDLAWR